MKKTLRLTFIAAILFIAVNSFAQTEQGKWMAGGSIGFNSNSHKETVITYDSLGIPVSSKEETVTTTTLDFSPQAGYFIMDNLAVGLNLSFESVKPKDVDATTTFSLGPFVRYYLPMKIFGQLGYNFGSMKTPVNNGTGSSTVTIKNGMLNVAVGYAWFLNDNVAIEPQVYYHANTTKVDVSGAKTQKSNDVGLAVGFQIYLGGGK